MQPPETAVVVGAADVLVVVGFTDVTLVVVGFTDVALVVVEVIKVVLVEVLLVLGFDELLLLLLPPPPPLEPAMLVSMVFNHNLDVQYLLPGPETEVVMLPLSIYTPDQ